MCMQRVSNIQSMHQIFWSFITSFKTSILTSLYLSLWQIQYQLHCVTAYHAQATGYEDLNLEQFIMQVLKSLQNALVIFVWVL